MIESAETLVLIDARGLARMLCASDRSIARWNSSGRLPKPLRIGRSIRWRRAEIEAWLEAGAPPRVKWEWIGARG